MLFGLMFTLPDTRFGGNATSEPGQTRDPPNVSGRKGSSNVGLATYGWQPAPVRQPAGLTAQRACGSPPRLDCQAGWDVYVRRPCRTPRRPGISWSFTAPTCI